jgi:hypothetical protein
MPTVAARPSHPIGIDGADRRRRREDHAADNPETVTACQSFGGDERTRDP